MKRKAFSIICLVLVFTTMVTGCANTKAGAQVNIKREKVEVSYEPTEYETKVEPYSIDSDLSNIENLTQFGEFTEEQKKLLAQNCFVVNPTKGEQLFYIYEDNQYKNIPSFVTTDSVLQVYHIFYDYTLRTLENEKLIGLLEELTDKMLENSISIYKDIRNREIKDIQLKNIAYFTVAEYCLERDITNEVPKEAMDMALEEYEKIKEHSGFAESSLFPYELDYSQYVPRGHYTRSKDFERYFRAMMWYGQAPFPLYFNEEERNIEQTLQALLVTYSICTNDDSFKLWEQIYEPTNFFVGSSDDLDIYQYGELLIKVYGNNPNLNKLNDVKKLDEFYNEAKNLPEPKIKPKYTSVTTPVGKQFRFMGQRYVLDAEIIQELVEPFKRPIPSGLDVMGVLGSDRAETIQMNKEENQKWEDYPKMFKKLKEKFGSLDNSEWKSNMYQGWLWTLKGLLEEYKDGYPSFMTNEAWTDKNLNSALASWSELKHDTILYGKQSGAECGDGYGQIKGYVEPNIEVYEKLLWLTKYSVENLRQRNLLVAEIEGKMDVFEELLNFLIDCSIKELKNEELTQEEYERIVLYGGTLEFLTASFAGEGLRWFEITSETDRNMAVIADFHTIAPNSFSEGGYLEAGVGPAFEIYVVVPIGDKLYLTRGGVFSYYEFVSEERLTDEKWQDMINRDIQPPLPEWTNSFISGDKGEIPFLIME